jgi:hypothetical protein
MVHLLEFSSLSHTMLQHISKPLALMFSTFFGVALVKILIFQRLSMIWEMRISKIISLISIPQLLNYAFFSPAFVDYCTTKHVCKPCKNGLLKIFFFFIRQTLSLFNDNVYKRIGFLYF